jgi:RNA polymerase sigma-70 factor (ECF subfamily)
VGHALTEICAGVPGGEDVLVRLLREAAGGDEVAFARLYDATSRRLYGLTQRILGEPKAAEEAALEAYWAVWQHAGDYDPQRGAPMTWMLTVARSKSIDMLRARRRRSEKEPPGLEPAQALADSSPSPEAATATAERCARLQTALAKLPPAQRVAIETTYFGGLSYAEAAAVLRAPLGTMKSRIRLGLQSLRHQLSEET